MAKWDYYKEEARRRWLEKLDKDYKKKKEQEEKKKSTLNKKP